MPDAFLVSVTEIHHRSRHLNLHIFLKLTGLFCVYFLVLDIKAGHFGKLTDKQKVNHFRIIKMAALALVTNGH